MKTIFLLLSLMIYYASYAEKQPLSGYVTDAASGEALAGVSIGCAHHGNGTTSNAYGYFALTMEPECVLTFSYIGYEVYQFTIGPATVLPLQIRLTERKAALEEVTVTAKATQPEAPVNQAGLIRLQVKTLSSIPVLGGERDIIKALQLMPGIKRGSEGNTAMLVRGGSADQNLILMDEAPLYQSGHLLGIFSVFNSDALRDISLQKGGFTANYGGRLSSVLDVKVKEGNMEKYQVEGGIGLLSSRLSVQGPIIKNRMSFIVSGRRTYIDQVFKMAGKSLPFYFYDINAKINYKLGDNDQLFVSAFYGKDVLMMDENNSIASSSKYDIDFGSTVQNATTTLRWNHVYANKKLFQHFTAYRSGFDYTISNRIGDNFMQITSAVEDYGIKADYDLFAASQNQFKWGGAVIHHHFRPNISQVNGDFNETIRQSDGQDLTSREFALYALNDRMLTARLGIQYGVRLSGSSAENKIYMNPEPRITMSYRLRPQQTIKASYSGMTQYMHLVSGSAAAMPTDLWFPVTGKIRPQRSSQISLTHSYELPLNDIVITTEAYYKKMSDLVEYREGTMTLMNDHIEDDLVQGSGKAYGLEWMLHKRSGRLNGWVGYSLSWSTRQFDELNGGQAFFMRYDKRHELSLVGIYEFTRRVTFSASWVYASGSRFTPVTGQYLMPKGNYTEVDVVPVYSKRNAVVLAASHRLDVNIVLKSKPRKRFESEWHFGAYNVYNRVQPYRIRINTDATGKMSYRQMGLFGFTPSIAYHFKF